VLKGRPAENGSKAAYCWKPPSGVGPSQYAGLYTVGTEHLLVAFKIPRVCCMDFLNVHKHEINAVLVPRPQFAQLVQRGHERWSGTWPEYQHQGTGGTDESQKPTENFVTEQTIRGIYEYNSKRSQHS